MNCDAWFHEGCLKKHQDPDVHPSTMSPKKTLSLCPIIRGWGGGRGLPWEIFRTGHKLKKVEENEGTEAIMEEVGDDFVKYMLLRNWVEFSCPECGGLV